jgi:cytoskeleton protein RodZ
MTEPVDDGVAGGAAPAGGTAGSLLRAAREAQGMELDTLAALLKVAPRKLEALEADRHAELQGATFVRALAQAACRALKQDPVPVLLRLPQADQGTLMHVSGGLNAPFREHGMLREAGDGWLARRGFSLFIGLLVLVAVGLFWLPGGWQDWLPWSSQHDDLATASPAASAVLNEGVPLGAPQDLSASAPEVTPVASSAVLPALGGAAPATSQPMAAADPAQVRTPVPVGAVPASIALPSVPSASTPSSPASAASALRGAEALQVRAVENSWVEVVDASGKLMLGRLMTAGETISLEGQMPLRVKLGNAKGTEVKFRGQAVDLSGATRDNVARLELK